MVPPFLRTFLRTFLYRIARTTDEAERGLSFELDGQLFSQPRLLPKTRASAENKAGLLSWLALMDRAPVKIYECCDESQAQFIKEISTNSPLKQYFPKCFMAVDKYLVVEWVQGKQLTWRWASKDERLLSEIAKLQALMHTFTMEAPQVSKCYYADLLRRRLAKFKGVFPIDEAIQEIYEILDEGIPIEVRVSHPDVTAANLILENSTGMLKIIDNELMTQNSYYLLDLFNTHRSFGRLQNHLLQEYLSHYVQNGGKLTPLVEHERFFEAMWQLRLIGTALQAGHLHSAFELANKFTKHAEEPHSLTMFVKENFI